MNPNEVPAGQIKGPIPRGPTPYVPCGPCSLEALQYWEEVGKKAGLPRPNIQAVAKRHIRTHLRERHGVDLAGQKIRFRTRSGGCQHDFSTAQRCPRCGVTQRDIAGRVKR